MNEVVVRLRRCIVVVFKYGGDTRGAIAAEFDSASLDIVEGGQCLGNNDNSKDAAQLASVGIYLVRVTGSNMGAYNARVSVFFAL